MLKVILVLVFVPVSLGFLLSNTLTMQGEMEKLQAQNQTLSYELVQLQAQYQTALQERDAALAQQMSVNDQLGSLQAAYLAENQARLKAEADAAIFQGLLLNLAGNVQAGLPAACVPAGQQAEEPQGLLLSTVVPVGASSLVTLAVAGMVAAMVNHSRKQRKLRSLPAQIRNLR